MINYPRNCPRSLTQLMGPADADVVEPAVVAEGDFAIGVDAVRADAVVGVGVAAVVGAVFGQRVVDACWGGPVGQ
jgi:hypothetical protein